MEDILSSDGLTANSRLGKRNVFRDALAEMMAYHEHVQVFVERIYRVPARW